MRRFSKAAGVGGRAASRRTIAYRIRPRDCGTHALRWSGSAAAGLSPPPLRRGYAPGSMRRRNGDDGSRPSRHPSVRKWQSWIVAQPSYVIGVCGPGRSGLRRVGGDRSLPAILAGRKWVSGMVASSRHGDAWLLEVKRLVEERVRIGGRMSLPQVIQQCIVWPAYRLLRPCGQSSA